MFRACNSSRLTSTLSLCESTTKNRTERTHSWNHCACVDELLTDIRGRARHVRHTTTTERAPATGVLVIHVGRNLVLLYAIAPFQWTESATCLRDVIQDGLARSLRALDRITWIAERQVAASDARVLVHYGFNREYAGMQPTIILARIFAVLSSCGHTYARTVRHVA